MGSCYEFKTIGSFGSGPKNTLCSVFGSANRDIQSQYKKIMKDEKDDGITEKQAWAKAIEAVNK